MLEKRADGTYVFTRRFWVTVIIGCTLICLIGVSTQRTANRTDALTQETRAYAAQTNQCLSQVVDVIDTRNGYNEAIYKLDERRNEVDLQRQAVWEKLVADLGAANNSDGLNLQALQQFQTANAEIKRQQAEINAEQTKLRQERRETKYPECPSKLVENHP